MRKTLSLFFVLCLCPALWAWQLPVTNYYPKDYAAGTQNWQLKQQRNGWIYAANNYGLLEFDGLRWALYGIWNSTVIRSIEISSDGTIYVGGANEFGYFKSNGFGGLDYTPLSLNIPDEYKDFGEVWNLHLLHDDLYIQTRNYFFKQAADGQLTVIEPKSRIFCSAKIRDGLFVATSDGIYLLIGNQLNALRGSELLRGYEIRAMQPYGENGVLIGTDFNGMFLFDGDIIRRFATDADAFLCENQLYTFVAGKKHIAYGTVLNGLIITDLDGKNCRYVNTQNGLQNNTVLSLLFDVDDNLWIGLDQGLDRLVIDSPISSLYGQLNSYGSGYASFISGSNIYLGTNQGLYSSPYPFDPTKMTSLSLVAGSLGQVWSLNELYGTLFCCHNRGLFSINGKRLKPIFTQEGFWQVRALPGDDNYILGGSYSGFYLMQMRQGQCVVLHKIKGFDVTSRNFEVDKDGHIWIVSNRGVERLTLDAMRQTFSAELIRPYGEQNDYFNIDKIDEHIVISNSSFCAMTNANGHLEEAPDFFALLDGVRHYSFIKKDSENNLWYLANDALKVRTYDMRTRKYAAQSVQITNQSRFFVGGFAHINPLAGNQAIVGCVSGFALADVQNAQNVHHAEMRPMLIRRMLITSPKDSVVYGQSFPIVSKTIKIAYRNNSVRFEFGGTFSLDGKEEYRVRLLPIDEDKDVWTRADTKEYTDLREGHYTLEVRSRSVESGQESKSVFEFSVLPPWYRSWWAYLVWLVLIMFVAYLVYLYFRRRIEVGRRKLEQQKDEEMRAREIRFTEEAHIREKEILRLQNERTEFELKNKSQELSNVLLNHLNKNELVIEMKHDLKKIGSELQDKDIDAAIKRISQMQGKLTRSIEQEIDWKKFEENFDIVNDKFLKKLMQKYPWLNKNERKLCVYIRIGLITKEIAPLMNLSTRGVEMLRYRMRKKMELDRSTDLENFFQMLSQGDDDVLSDENDENNDSNPS